MGETVGDLDVSRAIYLVLVLFIVVMGLRGLPSVVRRRSKPARCKACGAPIGSEAGPRAPWDGWTCRACGGPVESVRRRPSGTGMRGWMDLHPWAVHGAIWAFIVWGLLAGRNLWIGEPTPELVTLPLTVAGGLGVGWLLTLMHGRRR